MLILLYFQESVSVENQSRCYIGQITPEADSDASAPRITNHPAIDISALSFLYMS